jgi:cytochrome c
LVDPAETRIEAPNLQGVVGRPAGIQPGFRYSNAIRQQARAGLVWDRATLDAFLADPQAIVPGNSMGFFGLRDAQDRSDLIAYLEQAKERR